MRHPAKTHLIAEQKAELCNHSKHWPAIGSYGSRPDLDGSAAIIAGSTSIYLFEPNEEILETQSRDTSTSCNTETI